MTMVLVGNFVYPLATNPRPATPAPLQTTYLTELAALLTLLTSRLALLRAMLERLRARFRQFFAWLMQVALLLDMQGPNAEPMNAEPNMSLDDEEV